MKKQQKPSRSISQGGSLEKMAMLMCTLVLLVGCNGGQTGTSGSSSVAPTQSAAVANFYARRAIVLDALSKGNTPQIPQSLNLAKLQTGGQSGSMLGDPAYMVLNNALLVGNPTCVNIGSITEPSSFSAPSQSLSIISTTSSQSGAQQSAIAIALSTGIGLFSADSSTSINNSSLFSNTTAGFQYNYTNYGAHNASYTATSLTSLINENYVNSTGTSVNNLFIKQCGDSFVYSENYGVALVANIEVAFKTAAQASSFEQNTNASYATLASLSSKVRTSKNSSNSDSSVNITLTQQGGTPGSLPSGLNGISCSLESFSVCNAMLEKVNEYAKTLQSQITDTNGNPKPGAYIYTNPRLKKYTDLVNISSNQNLSIADAAAIDTVQNIYLQTLMLYYGFKSYPKILKATGLDNFNSKVYNKIINREIYISGVSQPCYESASACSAEILPKMITDLNTFPSLMIESKDLIFYATQLQSSNFLALNDLFSSSVSGLNATVFIPSNMAADGDNLFVNQYHIPGCTLGVTCAVGANAMTVSHTTESDVLIRYPQYQGLETKCTIDKDSGAYSCKGSTKNPYSGYRWTEQIDVSTVGGLTASQLTNYAKPSASIN